MKELEFIAISRLQKITAYNKNFRYQFHFLGFFKGHRINSIVACSEKEMNNLYIGGDFILYLKTQEIKNNTLFTKIISIKDIITCRH